MVKPGGEGNAEKAAAKQEPQFGAAVRVGIGVCFCRTAVPSVWV